MPFRLARHSSRSSCWGSRSIWTVMQHVPLSGRCSWAPNSAACCGSPQPGTSDQARHGRGRDGTVSSAPDETASKDRPCRSAQR